MRASPWADGYSLRDLAVTAQRGGTHAAADAGRSLAAIRKPPVTHAAAVAMADGRALDDAGAMSSNGVVARGEVRAFLLPAVVLGIGLGGLLDGIVLHQVLQWHHMASAVDPPTSVDALERNTLADGLFHVVAWLATVAGVVLLWRAAGIARGRARPGILVGGLLVGFAGFNLVEGVVDHLLLGVHHVREGPDAFAYDAAFLLLSAVLFVVGSAIVRRGVTRGATP